MSHWEPEDHPSVNEEVVGAINAGALELTKAIDEHSEATTQLASNLIFAQNRNFRRQYIWLGVLTAAYAALFYQHYSVSQLTQAQNECAAIVQRHYISTIGDLADMNGINLRKPLTGEVLDPNKLVQYHNDIRSDGTGARHIYDQMEEICFTSTPDKTPLDGDLTK